MKHSVALIVFVTLLISNLTIAQDWFQTGTRWTFNDQFLVPYPAHGIVEYTVKKDTVINDTIAKKINVVATSHLGVQTIRLPVFVAEIEDKIYIREDNQFRLMYDMGLKKGDTLKLINELCKFSPVIVDSLGSITVDSKELTVQYLSYTNTIEGEEYTYTEKVIEYIGNEADFIFRKYCLPVERFAYTGLRCYQNSEITYRNAWWKTHYFNVACDSIINERETALKAVPTPPLLQVHPNPTGNLLTVKVPHSHSNQTLTLFDMRGRLIFHKQADGMECTLDLSLLPKGVYVVKLNVANQEVQFVKVLKQ